jgi:phage antirepressor YoqD-like protein
MNELALGIEKTMTTAEIAQQLGTKPNVITENAKKCLPNKRIENGKTTFWTQEEITILLDFIKSHKVGAGVNLSNDLIGVYTDLTPALKIKKAMELMQEGYEEELQILRAKNLEQAQQLAIQAPKAQWFDDVADSSNLVEIGTVGKMLGIGQNNFFAILQMNKVIYKKCVDDIEYYLAYSEYEKYFKSVPIPFKKSDGTKLTRNKLMFTQGGAQWAEKRFSTKG